MTEPVKAHPGQAAATAVPGSASDSDGPRDACGVFAAYAPGEDVAKLCFYGLYALQHRGQESAGIAVSDGDDVLVSKEMGLVSQVFDERALAGLDGHLGIGHVRYSTAGASTWDNAQPAFKTTPSGDGIAVGHNGNLVATDALADRLGADTDACSSDSELLAALLAADGDLEVALGQASEQITGAYSLVAMDNSAVYGLRDPHGVRPLVLGRLPGDGHVLASETGALDLVGARVVRDVAPGELVVADADGVRSYKLSQRQPHFCLFEYVYLARPDHRTEDRADGSGQSSVAGVRRRMGELLADEAPADADLVVPVPDSGVAAASGYAQRAGLAYAEGLVKNRYVGRTFIEPSPTMRELGIRLKLNPLPDVLAGQRLVVVDDSIVRGNTSRQLVSMLRQAGAAEVHLRVSCPPVRHPCYYGIDMASRDELVGSGRSVAEVAEFVGADSLAYLSLEATTAATGQSTDSLCRACFDGHYIIPVPGEPAAETVAGTADARLAEWPDWGTGEPTGAAADGDAADGDGATPREVPAGAS
jgi:amidophosphoribosyltransferase